MGGHSIIIVFFAFLIPVGAATIGGIYLYEKKKGRKITTRFREFSKKYKITEMDLRSVPRILIPDSINVSVKLSEKPYTRLKGKVVDMSLSGFRVSFRSPFKAIPEDQVFRDVVIITPLNRISIKSLKIVRIENSVKKVIFALYIKDVDESDYADLKNTMIYFEKFSKNGN
ncbi:MAG: PilZ domain-containing protein [Acidobacteriota bacterium]